MLPTTTPPLEDHARMTHTNNPRGGKKCAFLAPAVVRFVDPSPVTTLPPPAAS